MDTIHAKGALIMQANTYLDYEGIKGETTAEG